MGVFIGVIASGLNPSTVMITEYLASGAAHVATARKIKIIKDSFGIKIREIFFKLVIDPKLVKKGLIDKKDYLAIPA